ncbi:Plasmid maintenance system antidote protein [Marinobacter sp. ELB17]|nr:Plasmid maintenance system antidote protein [Marinobacter sp. ELB17]
MSVNALSKALHLPATRMNEIMREKRSITANKALRLARYFGTSERFWLNLQTEFELRRAQINKVDKIAREIQPRAAEAPKVASIEVRIGDRFQICPRLKNHLSKTHPAGNRLRTAHVISA